MSSGKSDMICNTVTEILYLLLIVPSSAKWAQLKTKEHHRVAGGPHYNVFFLTCWQLILKILKQSGHKYELRCKTCPEKDFLDLKWPEQKNFQFNFFSLGFSTGSHRPDSFACFWVKPHLGWIGRRLNHYFVVGDERTLYLKGQRRNDQLKSISAG